jgi:hypothetical protein
MGLESNVREGKKFVGISRRNGKFSIRVTEDTEGAIPRQLEQGPNEGKTVYEKFYDRITGKISKINYKTNDKYGDSIEVYIDDCVLNINWGDFSVRDSFIKRLPNIDLEKDVECGVFLDKETKRIVFVVRQDGEVVPYAFTREEPNGIPQAIKKEERGKEIWDFSVIENFLYDVLMEHIRKFEDD